MSRDLTVAQKTAADGKHRKTAPLLELLFDSGTLRISLAQWDIVVGAITYSRLNSLLEVQPLQESSGSIEGFNFTLSGLDPAIIVIATQEQYRGRIVRLMKVYLNADTNAVIGAPSVRWVGRMRSMAIQETNDKCTVALAAEHYEAELTRAAPLRFNDSDQQRLYPGDLGCQYVEEMVDKTLVWPARGLSGIPGGGGGRGPKGGQRQEV